MSSRALNDVLITGLGVVSPIGLNRQAIWQAIDSKTSGVESWPEMAEARWMAPYCGAVRNFDGKAFVKPRKSLKIMCPEMQFAAAAAELAWEDAGLDDHHVDPQRSGIVAGAAGEQFCHLEELQASYLAWLREEPFNIHCWPKSAIDELFPLWMLKYLPNLNACHVGIRRDFRGPTNTISIGDPSSLQAVAEAAHVIHRGSADLMLAGGSSSYLSATLTAFHAGARLAVSDRPPAEICRPFDRDHMGMVYGEGAAFFILENRAHATRRGANAIGRVVAAASRCEPSAFNCDYSGKSTAQAVRAVLHQADVEPHQVGHVNAHGNSTIEDDPAEAQAIQNTLGDVPVTAPKSFFGNLSQASGAVELAVSLIALERGVIPPTLNYENPDPACPVNVVTDVQPTKNRTFLALNHSPNGQAMALLVAEA